MRRTSNSENSNLQTQLDSLKTIVAEMMEEIVKLRNNQEIQFLFPLKLTQTIHLITSSVINVNIFAKKQVTLRKHMNTKHEIIEPEEVDIVVHNITNEKELKEA